MKASFREKYKAFIIFIVVFLIAFFGTRALVSKFKKDQPATIATEKVADTTTIKTTK